MYVNSTSKSVSSRKRLRRFATSVTIATAALVSVGAASTDAAVRTSSGATAATWFSCNPQIHTINYQVSMTPARRFTSQQVAYRIWVYEYATRTGFWTAWHHTTAPGETAHFTSLPFSAGRNNYKMYMAYAWWNGRNWVTAGEWIHTYTQQTLHGGHFQQAHCTA